MPLTAPTPLSDHLDQESTTLATLWEITRVDGQTYYFTDHDRDIVFQGTTYKTGVGYDRTAIEDKADLSSDNLDVKGILTTTDITREDIRGGLFDGAEVWIRVVNWQAPQEGAIVRRRGWLGEVKQNNLGQFSSELRGLADALTENFGRVYTPLCAADLGSQQGENVQAVCGRKMIPDLREDDTFYEATAEVRFPGVDDLIFRATKSARSGVDPYDVDFDGSYLGDTFSDGEQVWLAVEPWRILGTVLAEPAPSTEEFEVSLTCQRLIDDPRHFDGGLATFVTGANAGISREIKFVDSNSSGEYTTVLYLKAPFEVAAGDTIYFFPGCNKTIETCAAKFANSINFAGFPHIPGDNYLRNYPIPK